MLHCVAVHRLAFMASAIGFCAHASISQCPADLNDDLTVDASDLATVLAHWGGAGGDIDGDGTTSGTDLSALVGGWGGCPVAAQRYLVSTTGGATTTAYDATTHQAVQTWTGAAGAASVGYLRADGSLVRPTVHVGGAYPGAARGGRIQIFSANGALTSDFLVSTAQYQQHHDVRPLPNGNILCIVWEGHTQAEGLAAGRVGLTSAIWSESILEVRATGATTFEIVWRWNLWDHLIQGANPDGANYGIVSDHPERVDINIGAVVGGGGGGGPVGDWIHMNSIDYSADRDEIVMSSRTLNELLVIDHSTTTEQAATHTGGACGKGGDILYMLGNPANYGRGASSDRRFDTVHSATWIRAGLPGAGNILCFNNGDRAGATNDYSTVMEIIPPRDASGNYWIEGTAAFGPSSPTWSCGAPGQFYGGPTQCGAFRTTDNTTIITLTNSGRVFEVSAAGATLWERTGLGTGVARVPKYTQINGQWIGP